MQKKDYVDTVYVYSNLSSELNMYLKLLENRKVELNFSWHSINDDTINKGFYEKAKQLCSFNGIHKSISFNVMYEQCHVRQALMMHKLLKKLGAIADLAQVGQLDKVNSVGRYNYYSKIEHEEFKSAIDENQHMLCPEVQIRYSDNSYIDVTLNYLMDMLDTQQISFYRWKCNAGVDRYYVHCDGMVYRCQQEYENGLDPMFQLADKIDFNERKPCICKCQVCWCEGFVEKEIA